MAVFGTVLLVGKVHIVGQGQTDGVLFGLLVFFRFGTGILGGIDTFSFGGIEDHMGWAIGLNLFTSLAINIAAAVLFIGQEGAFVLSIATFYLDGGVVLVGTFHFILVDAGAHVLVEVQAIDTGAFFVFVRLGRGWTSNPIGAGVGAQNGGTAQQGAQFLYGGGWGLFGDSLGIAEAEESQRKHTQ